MKFYTPYLLLIVGLLLPVYCTADTVPDASIPANGVVDRASANAAKLLEHFRRMSATTSYRYQETRILDLVDAPWHGSGYLFSGTDGTLIKLQLTPERIIMAVTATRMYYYNAAEEQRYSAPLDFTVPGVEQIGAFRSILQGRTTELYADYTVDIQQRESRWTLHLTGKAPHNAGLLIEVSGDEAKPQRKIIIQQADGEKSEYNMKPAAAKQPPETSVERLLAEAAGRSAANAAGE